MTISALNCIHDLRLALRERDTASLYNHMWPVDEQDLLSCFIFYAYMTNPHYIDKCTPIRNIHV